MICGYRQSSDARCINRDIEDDESDASGRQDNSITAPHYCRKDGTRKPMVPVDRAKEEAIRDTLRSANLLNGRTAEKLCHAVFDTLALWKAEKTDAPPLREQHDHLKGIWNLLQESDPPIRQIRGRFKSLPYASRYHLRRSAARLWPRSFNLGSDCDPFPYIERMGQKQLLRRLPRLLAEGGYIKGNTPADFEPTILGVTRGLDDGPSGGRPRGDDELRLVTYLVFDWLYATGKLPKRGRKTEKGFGELVRHVFNWTTSLKPEQALRRYWEQVPKLPEDAD